MKRTALEAVRIIGVLLLFVGTCLAGPFGFEYGMTKTQVIKLVGKDAVKADLGDMLELKTAPKPHGLFELYHIIFSPERGLIKIFASSRTISTSQYGD